MRISLGIYVVFVVWWCLATLVAARPKAAASPEYGAVAEVYARSKRQFDFTLSAEHDDKEDETEVALEAIANLWRSHDGSTQVEGSAKVIHRSNSLQSDPNHWRLGLKVVFH